MRTVFSIIFVAGLGAFIGYISAGGDARKVGISDEVADRGEAMARHLRVQLNLVVTDAKLAFHPEEHIEASPAPVSAPAHDLTKPVPPTTKPVPNDQ